MKALVWKHGVNDESLLRAAKMKFDFRVPLVAQ